MHVTQCLHVNEATQGNVCNARQRTLEAIGGRSVAIGQRPGHPTVVALGDGHSQIEQWEERRRGTAGAVVGQVGGDVDAALHRHVEHARKEGQRPS